MSDRPTTTAAAVWIVHGLLDNLVTAWAVHTFQTTTLESNPYLKAAYSDALVGASSTATPAYLAVPVFAKAGAALLAASLVLLLPCYVGRRATLAYGAVVTVAGLLVVLNNLLAIGGGHFAAW